jgi:hypothetical protein
VRSHAKATSAGSIEGNVSNRSLIRRAFATRGAAGNSKGSSAPSRRAPATLVAVTLSTASLLTASFASAADLQTMNDPADQIAYTSIKVSGTVFPDPGVPSFPAFEMSTDGVNWPNRLDGETVVQPSDPPAQMTREFTGLTPGTQYFFRIKVDRFRPTEYSNVITATTLSMSGPTVLSASDATDVSYVTAKASGSVEGVDRPSDEFAADFDSDCRFEYVSQSVFESDGFYQGAPSAPCSVNPVVGDGPTPVSAELTNLAPDTTYHLRLRIANAGGVDTKEVSTFTTLHVDPPTAIAINDAANVEYSKAELSGKAERPANPDPAFDAQCRFEYVSSLEYGVRDEVQRVVVKATGGTFTLGLGEQTSAPIKFNASTTEMQSALEALSKIGSGDVTVSGGPGDEDGENPYILTFTGALTGQGVDNLAIDGSGLQPVGESSAEWQFVADGHGAEGFNHASTVPCNPEMITNPAGTEPVKATVTANLSELAPGTTYHYRLAVSNAGGSDTKEAVNTFTTLVPGAPAVSILPPSTVTATSAHLAGTINPGGTDPGFNVNWHFRCTPKCPGIEGGTIAADESTHEVSVDATGLKANTSYSVVLIATNAAAKVVAGPELFMTAAAKPVVTTFPAFALAGGTEALVGGKVDPENSATKYWIEYGSDESYGASIPAAQDASAGAGNDSGFVTQKVSGLQPSTTYHFRLVAANSVGAVQGADKTFTTAPPTGLGSSIGKLTLPDNRAWEQVSPVDKNGSDVWKVDAQASVSGGAITFKSQGSFADQPTAKGGLQTDYLSKRGAGGWSTAGITPPGGLFNVGVGYHAFSPDLAFATLLRSELVYESLDPEFETDPTAINQTKRYYIRNNSTGTYRVQPESSPPSAFGAADDYSRVVFQREDELTPDGCVFFCVYEQAGIGPVKLASKLPDGNFEYGQYAGISRDGSRVYFTGLLTGHLYARVDGSSTIQLDESERTVPPVGGGSGVSLGGFSDFEGEQAVFASAEELVDADEDSATDLYAWDGSKPVGERLTLVSQGDMPGVEAQFAGFLGSEFDQLSREDMRRGYFTASNQILAGQPDAPGQKIYFWEGDGGQSKLSYVATGSVTSSFGGAARVSPNGRYLAFASNDRLTAYDSAGKQEVYRYDSLTDQLVCVSCEPGGRPAKADASFNYFRQDESTGESEYLYPMPHVLRNLSADGKVFFQSPESLSPHDSNGLQDVYEYQNGLPYLISAGTGAGESRFLDASADGNDVFFATSDGLVGWDKGSDFDVYDARVGGGLPEPPPPVIGCDGDACQPPPTPPNDPTPASASFNGAGNVTQKAGRKQHKKRHHKKRERSKQRQHGPSTRKHG